MQSKAATVAEYIESLPSERQVVIAKVRALILKNLPEGYEEGMQYGMISYYIPLSRYPETYNGQALGYVALASQKNYLSIYLMNVYGNKETEEWFTDSYKKSGKKLNMGKSCVRFKKLEDLPLDLIGETIAKTSVEEFISLYAKSRKK